MALGEFRLFRFKSKSQIEQEDREYAAWAFPYGDLQRERLTNLVKELDPKASLQLSLATYLTCKEIYGNTLKESESKEAAAETMINVIKSYGQLIRSSEMPFYVALVIADAEVDESCSYPSADDMRARILELENKRVKKRKGWRRII